MAWFKNREGRFTTPNGHAIACPVCAGDHFRESKRGFYGDMNIYTQLRCLGCGRIQLFAGWKHLLHSVV